MQKRTIELLDLAHGNSYSLTDEGTSPDSNLDSNARALIRRMAKERVKTPQGLRPAYVWAKAYSPEDLATEVLLPGQDPQDPQTRHALSLAHNASLLAETPVFDEKVHGPVIAEGKARRAQRKELARAQMSRVSSAQAPSALPSNAFAGRMLPQPPAQAAPPADDVPPADETPPGPATTVSSGKGSLLKK